MRKYLMMSLAVIAAIFMLAFAAKQQSSKRTNGLVVLKFTGTFTDPSSITTLSNWVEDPSFDPDESCSGCPGACAMNVPETYLIGTTPNRTLNPSLITLSYTAGCYGAEYGYYPVVNNGSLIFFTWKTE